MQDAWLIMGKPRVRYLGLPQEFLTK